MGDLVPTTSRALAPVRGIVGAAAGAAATMPVSGFRWRMNGGELRAPSAMATTHLFYTLRMIWNNCAPAHARVGKVKLYDFGPSYTTAYMRQAVRALSIELGGRRDLPAWMRRELEEMAAHLRAEPLLIEVQA